MVKPRYILPLLLPVAFVACEPPGEIQIREYDSGVDVTSLVEPDTVFGFSPVDSTALLPRDQTMFAGSFVVNSIRHDGVNGTFRFSFAKVYIGDPAKPVVGPHGQLGHTGFDLGMISLNGRPMLERPHILPGIDTVVSAGLEYVSNPDFSYVPGATYAWTVDSIAGPALTIEAPALVEVLHPEGGAIVPRDRPLHLEWLSDEEIVIVVSRVSSFGRPVPMLLLRPWDVGYAVVSPKILDLLPEDGAYLFTFIRANREEVTINRPFLQGTLLVQAASVHTVVLQLR